MHRAAAGFAIFAIVALGMSTTSARKNSVSYGDPKFGVVTSILLPQHGAKVSELGTGSVRLNFYWWLLEPAQDAYDWGAVDSWLNEAQARGLSVFASMSGTPAWAGPCEACMPYQILDWYDFVWQVIKHIQVNYPSLDIVFGVWNEPNLGNFLNDDSQGTKYRQLFQYADAARDDANPSAILGGPETSHHAVGTYYNVVMQDIVQHMNPSDKVTVHWYPDQGYLPGYMSFGVEPYSYGRDIWLTETGYASCSDSTQRTHITNILNDFYSTSVASWRKTFIYVLQTGLSCDESIVRGDWTNRQAFDFYKAWISTH